MGPGEEGVAMISNDPRKFGGRVLGYEQIKAIISVPKKLDCRPPKRKKRWPHPVIVNPKSKGIQYELPFAQVVPANPASMEPGPSGGLGRDDSE
jgi:hypothetical protein